MMEMTASIFFILVFFLRLAKTKFMRTGSKHAQTKAFRNERQRGRLTTNGGRLLQNTGQIQYPAVPAPQQETAIYSQSALGRARFFRVNSTESFLKDKDGVSLQNSKFYRLSSEWIRFPSALKRRISQ